MAAWETGFGSARDIAGVPAACRRAGQAAARACPPVRPKPAPRSDHRPRGSPGDDDGRRRAVVDDERRAGGNSGPAHASTAHRYGSPPGRPSHRPHHGRTFRSARPRTHESVSRPEIRPHQPPPQPYVPIGAPPDRIGGSPPARPSPPGRRPRDECSSRPAAADACSGRFATGTPIPVGPLHGRRFRSARPRDTWVGLPPGNPSPSAGSRTPVPIGTHPAVRSDRLAAPNACPFGALPATARADECGAPPSADAQFGQ